MLEATGRSDQPAEVRPLPHRVIPQMGAGPGRRRTKSGGHLFKDCRRWRPRWGVLWAEVWGETGRGKDRFKIRDLFADEA